MEATLGSVMPDAIPDATLDVGFGVATSEAPYGVSLASDAALFAGQLQAIDGAASQLGPVAQAMLDPLERMNVEARDLVAFAEQAVASGDDLSPSEIVRLTAMSQEFMFHAQLTANVANRTSDGLQQLFRQQS